MKRRKQRQRFYFSNNYHIFYSKCNLTNFDTQINLKRLIIENLLVHHFQLRLETDHPIVVVTHTLGLEPYRG